MTRRRIVKVRVCRRVVHGAVDGLQHVIQRRVGRVTSQTSCQVQTGITASPQGTVGRIVHYVACAVASAIGSSILKRLKRLLNGALVHSIVTQRDVFQPNPMTLLFCKRGRFVRPTQHPPMVQSVVSWRHVSEIWQKHGVETVGLERRVRVGRSQEVDAKALRRNALRHRHRAVREYGAF